MLTDMWKSTFAGLFLGAIAGLVWVGTAGAVRDCPPDPVLLFDCGGFVMATRFSLLPAFGVGIAVFIMWRLKVDKPWLVGLAGPFIGLFLYRLWDALIVGPVSPSVLVPAVAGGLGFAAAAAIVLPGPLPRRAGVAVLAVVAAVVSVPIGMRSDDRHRIGYFAGLSMPLLGPDVAGYDLISVSAIPKPQLLKLRFAPSGMSQNSNETYRRSLVVEVFPVPVDFTPLQQCGPFAHVLDSEAKGTTYQAVGGGACEAATGEKVWYRGKDDRSQYIAQRDDYLVTVTSVSGVTSRTIVESAIRSLRQYTPQELAKI